MGILDSISSTVNRGTESAGRAAEKVKLKNQINEINKRRQQLAAQLGASLYDATKQNAELCQGREALYAGIEACDDERLMCQEKIEQIDAMSQAATVAASTFKCAVCGATVGGGDLFCSGCGTPVAQARPATNVAVASAGGAVCTNCGAAVMEGDKFCMSCGTPVAQALTGASAPTVVSGPVCASCGASLEEGDQFCMSCGTKVQAGGIEEAEIVEVSSVSVSGGMQ